MKMIEKTVEHEIKHIYDSSDHLRFAMMRVCRGDISLSFDGIPDSLEEIKEFHAALGEAIQIAEAQNNE
jgi:hypothetical protein